MLGLLEVELVADKLARRRRDAPGPSAAAMAAATAAKLQRYLLVRTGMSIVTGLAVWAFARLAGLELAGALLVFLGPQVIQFLSGSYIEPRVAVRAFALSPFMVLLAVFLWYFLWGLAGPSSACRSSSRRRRSVLACRRCAASPSCSAARRRLTSAATPIARARCRRAPAAASRTAPAPR